MALLGAVAGDVSHLNNMYLPPVLAGLSSQQHVSYAQESHEIPQASVQEVVDNSVVEFAPAQEEADKSVDASVVAHHVQKAAVVAHQVQAHAHQGVAVNVRGATPAAPGSEVYQSTHQQAAHFTQVSQNQEEEQQQQPEQQYYTGLIIPQRQEEQSAGAEEQHDEVNEDVAAPQQYYTGAIVQQDDEINVAAPHVEHHASALEGSSDSASSGIDTQYAADGGYVY